LIRRLGARAFRNVAAKPGRRLKVALGDTAGARSQRGGRNPKPVINPYLLGVVGRSAMAAVVAPSLA
jgi:hypothetical protein